MQQNEVLILLYKLSTTLTSDVNNELRKYRLTFQQYLVLDFLLNQKEEVIGRDICRYLKLSHPTVAGLVTRLVVNNLVTVKTTTLDRRQTLIQMTHQGEKVVLQAKDSVKKVTQRVEETLSTDEIQVLKKLLVRLDDNIGGGIRDGNI